MADFATEADLALQLGISLGHVAAAMTIAFAVGSALAVLPSAAPAARRLVDGRLTPFLNAFSGIGWLFLAILWFGINSTTVIFAVTMVLTPFAIINLRTGLAEMDRDLMELGESLTRSPLRRFLKLALPMLALGATIYFWGRGLRDSCRSDAIAGPCILAALCLFLLIVLDQPGTLALVGSLLAGFGLSTVLLSFMAPVAGLLSRKSILAIGVGLIILGMCLAVLV